MDAEDHSRLLERALTRRALLKYGAGALGGAALASAVAACGGNGGEAAPPAAPPAEPPPAEPPPAEPPPPEPPPAEPPPAEPPPAEPAQGGTLRVAFGDGQSEDSLDPALQFTGVGIAVGAMVYDNLLHTDNDWNLTPAIAEDWSASDDATEYSFKIRQGVEFHSGKQVEAADVAEHILRLLDEKTGSGGLSLLGSVLDPSGVKVGDPTTITFTLKAPDAYFGLKMAHYYTRIPQAGTTDWLGGSPGTGPFKSVSFRPSEGNELVRNENYWQEGLPYLDEVSIVVISEQATKTEAVLSGDVDISDPPPLAAVEQFESSDVATLIPVSNTPYTFDVDSSIKPYSDPRVSQAMKMMIDREKALQFIVRGQGVISADSLIHPSDPYYPADLEPFPYDPEQARALLAEAGYPDGFEENIWTTKAYPYLDEGAAIGQEAFEAGGLKITIQSVSNDRYLAAFLNEPIVMDYYGRQHPAVHFDLYYHSGPQNTTRLNDPQVDSMVDEFKRTLDPARQKELAGEIIRRYNDIAAEIVPFHFDDLWAHKNRVQNLVLSPYSRFEYSQIQLA